MTRNLSVGRWLWKAGVAILLLGCLSYFAYRYLSREHRENHDDLQNIIETGGYSISEWDDDRQRVSPLLWGGDVDCAYFLLTANGKEYEVNIVSYRTILERLRAQHRLEDHRRMLGSRKISDVAYRSTLILLYPKDRAILRNLRELIRNGDN